MAGVSTAPATIAITTKDPRILVFGPNHKGHQPRGTKSGANTTLAGPR
jgi:hypothetical protein